MNHCELSKLVTLHNIADIVQTPEGGRLQRVPEPVRLQLEEHGKARYLNPAGAEIRLVPGESTVRVTLSTVNGTGIARLFFGPFDSRNGAIAVGTEPVTIDMSIPRAVATRLSILPDTVIEELAFSPAVSRLQLTRDCFVFHGIEGECRPPRKDEVPPLTMLAYGTSLAQGYMASGAHLSFPAQTAWRLGTDVLNLAVGGGGVCEKAIGDYIAGRNDYDYAILDLSENLYFFGYGVDGFRERAGGFLRSLTEAHPKLPVWCISLFPNYGDWLPGGVPANDVPRAEYEAALDELVHEFRSPYLNYVPSGDLFTRMTGFAADLVHHSDMGMVRVAENLARICEPVIKGIAAKR